MKLMDCVRALRELKRKTHKQIIIVVASVMILCMPILVFAHPGRTDSDGGHYDHSTGEYHYHHGYPAHQHPNGVCPYDDKIKNNSGTTKTIPFTQPEATITPTAQLEMIVVPTVQPDTPSQSGNGGHVVMWFLLLPLACGLIFIVWCLLRRKTKAKSMVITEPVALPYSSQLKKSYNSPTLVLTAPQQKAVYVAPTISITEPPEYWRGVGIDEHCFPYVIDRKNGYGRRFNAYITPNGNCYHRSRCKKLHDKKAVIHIYGAIADTRLKPCKLCNPRTTIDEWYLELFPEKRVLKKYTSK
jgi:hypothetical protein